MPNLKKLCKNRQFLYTVNVRNPNIRKWENAEIGTFDSLNTKLSGTGPKVDRPKSKHVQILDVDCTVNHFQACTQYFFLFFGRLFSSCPCRNKNIKQLLRSRVVKTTLNQAS